MQISLKNICKSYRNSQDAPARIVLKDLNLEIQSGEKIAVMGPSGSGKTTLLNILGTLDKANSGSVFFDRMEVQKLSQKALLELRNKDIGFIFQFHYLLPQCTLLENVLLPTLPLKADKIITQQRAEELLKLMGIWEYRHQKPEALSGGECQRAAVARALINQPQILLADEPTGSLDQENSDLLIQLLLDINQQMNITLVIATHADEIARKMAKIYTVSNMQLIENKAKRHE